MGNGTTVLVRTVKCFVMHRSNKKSKGKAPVYIRYLNSPLNCVFCYLQLWKVTSPEF